MLKLPTCDNVPVFISDHITGGTTSENLKLFTVYLSISIEVSHFENCFQSVSLKKGSDSLIAFKTTHPTITSIFAILLQVKQQIPPPLNTSTIYAPYTSYTGNSTTSTSTTSSTTSTSTTSSTTSTSTTSTSTTSSSTTSTTSTTTSTTSTTTSTTSTTSTIVLLVLLLVLLVLLVVQAILIPLLVL
jgi:hypothetical protein